MLKKTAGPVAIATFATIVNRHCAYPLPNTEELVNTVAQDKYYGSLDLRSAYHQVSLLPEEKQYTAFEASARLF